MNIIDQYLFLKPNQKKDDSVFVVPVNGFLKKDGKGVMAISYAGEARRLFKGIDSRWGKALESQGRLPGFEAELKAPGVGNHCAIIFNRPIVVAFPTQWDFYVRGRYGNARIPTKVDLSLIERSCGELAMLADKYSWTNVRIPIMGPDQGIENFKNDVFPIMNQYFDDRFSLCIGSKG